MLVFVRLVQLVQLVPLVPLVLFYFVLFLSLCRLTVQAEGPRNRYRDTLFRLPILHRSWALDPCGRAFDPQTLGLI